jgi:hypothetical protein
VTIFRTLLARGYFPKELPPAFFTEQFAAYATTKAGRSRLLSYKPSNGFTEPVGYRLALPGDALRQLRIPHPASFATLAAISAKGFKRLLRRAGVSRLSKSRPVYGTGRYRAISPLIKPANLGRERVNSRAGAAFLLKADVSQFYPSLYTHAIGWAIDPKLRNKAHWKSSKLLGRKIDQALMNLQGKVSQGIPIGNDLSFLLAEVVLSRVDKASMLDARRSYRWFDDYELSFDNRDAAEQALARLAKELYSFRLRLNHQKTRIVPLPQPTQDEWQEVLLRKSAASLASPRDMVQYFDEAFRQHERFPHASMLMYAIGLLFRVTLPKDSVGIVAQSGITQALLCEPGTAQKAFALLNFWRLNGLTLDRDLLSRTVSRIVAKHAASGVSSDVAWSLAFCLEQRIGLDALAGRVLADCEDDCIAIQALHMNEMGLLPTGFRTKRIRKALRSVDLDGEHWLLGHEALRQGFLADSASAVRANGLFADLLARKISFYRTVLPPYASVVHPGGAPEWAVQAWIKDIRDPRRQRQRRKVRILELMRRDILGLEKVPGSGDDTIAALLDTVASRERTPAMTELQPYSVG